jgi:hypothetical protein
MQAALSFRTLFCRPFIAAALHDVVAAALHVTFIALF